MTPEDIIVARRVRVLELAAELGNITKACELLGVSRTSYYRRLDIVERYGLDALRPRTAGDPSWRTRPRPMSSRRC